MAYDPIWLQQLQPASFRGIVFQVEDSTYETGRRVVEHAYPLKDSVWLEDLGLNKQQFSFSGFLVGDDVYDQRNALAEACNTAGTGVLIHPSLGSQTAALVSASFSERKDSGRVVEVRFSFVISTAPTFTNLYPSVGADTQSDVDDGADDVDDGAADDFFSEVSSALNYGSDVVSGITDTASEFGSQVLDAVGDAGSAISAVAGLGSIIPTTYSLGRFAAGNLSSALNPVLSGIDATQSVFVVATQGTSALIDAAATSSAEVQTAVNSVSDLAMAL